MNNMVEHYVLLRIRMCMGVMGLLKRVLEEQINGKFRRDELAVWG